jgi:N-acetylmuramoyl-L-alanine amidase
MTAGKIRFLLLACVGATLVWGVAPALSLRPYAPQPSDFTQPVPEVSATGGPGAARSSHGHADEGPVRFVSPVIDAPARFDLVGIEGELDPVEYRARPEGGEWTDWIETANGDPVYFGGADELQLRSRVERPDGQLHYVNVSGTETLASTLLNDVRGAVNSAFIAVAGTAIAGAQPPQPGIVTRDAWGASACPPRTTASYGEVRAATVHHTVTANDYSAAEAPGIVLGICRFHRNGNGWNDIGYNFVIDRFGTIYEGRAGGIVQAVVGAHAQGYNSQTFGTASLGTHTGVGVTEQAKQAFAQLIAWKLAVHGTIAAGKVRLISGGGSANKYPTGKKVRLRRVFGHGRVGETACPGAALKRQIKEIRHRAQAIIDQNPGPAAPMPG